SWEIVAWFVFFSPSTGEAPAWPAEGTLLSLAFGDAFSRMCTNLFKRLGLVEQGTLSEVPTEESLVQQPRRFNGVYQKLSTPASESEIKATKRDWLVLLVELSLEMEDEELKSL
ncbi:hypothetical protein Tco_1543026, partial [Tanacetum coccineum]